MYSNSSSLINGASNRIIDFRSDTVTKPSSEMRKGMATAIVGDDVYKEDPTVNELESTCATLFGMEACLFVASGTMGNLISVLTHCNRGDEIILGNKQHIYLHEQSGYAQFGGISAMLLPNNADGTLVGLDDSVIRNSSDFHQPRTKLICLENTQGYFGGIPLTAKYMSQVREFANKHKLAIHVDGARIYNAAIALGTTVSELLVHADSVSMCFSKGLGCPVGAVIGGSKEFIAKALRLRKALGGGMRQVGVLAAPALYALKTAQERLESDHRNAKLLAEGIHKLGSDKLWCDVSNVHTNMVIPCTEKGKAKAFCEAMATVSRKHNLPLVLAFPRADSIRFVTHCDLSSEDVKDTLHVFECVLKECM